MLAIAGTQQPTITSSPRTTIGLGSKYLYQVEVLDPSGAPLTYSLPTAPAGMTIDATGLVRWQAVAKSVRPQLGERAGGGEPWPGDYARFQR